MTTVLQTGSGRRNGSTLIMYVSTRWPCYIHRTSLIHKHPKAGGMFCGGGKIKDEIKTRGAREARRVGSKVSLIAKDDVPVTVTGSVADSLRPV